MDGPIVTLENVSFGYGASPALEGVNIHIERGQVFGIVGPNGGGKTTLLKLVADLIKPSSGKITFNLKSGDKNPRIGYMPQYASVNWSFPVKVSDVILMGLYGELGMFHRPGRRERELAHESAQRIGIDELINRHISELSGGQQQRVFIARALAAKPEILLLDEPAANMDAAAQDMLYNQLEKLRDELGLTVLLVTHDMGVVPKICNQVACVNRIVEVHDKPENLTCPITKDYLGTQKEILLHGDFPHRMVRRDEGGPERTGHRHEH
ncbi:MAG: metal ABC transporter ATP-binding protein [bacterium]